MSTLISDPDHEQIRRRGFTRREFLQYEAVMQGLAPLDEAQCLAQSPSARTTRHDLDERLTWEQWLTVNPGDRKSAPGGALDEAPDAHAQSTVPTD